jgi:hypothetical protein
MGKLTLQPTLKGFIKNLLAEYLYSFCYFDKYGKMPFGERSHGNLGKVESYKEFFNTDSELTIIELLRIIVEDNYRGHLFCPCKSKRRLRDCHGEQLREIKKVMKREYFLYDLDDCKRSYKEAGNKLPSNFISKKLQSYRKKVKSKRTKK